MMAALERRLATDSEFAGSYRLAHEQYLRERARFGSVPEVGDVSAGGMPKRVKCLHALVAHALAAGPGVNLVGDSAVARLRELGCWPCPRPCVAITPNPETTVGA